MNIFARSVVMGFSLGLATMGFAQDKIVSDDLAVGFKAPAVQADYEKRVVMVPMRDGVKLYTVIVIPKAAIANKGNAPIVLTRTCYNAAARAERSKSSEDDGGAATERRDFCRRGVHPRVPGCAREVWERGAVPDDSATRGPV
jgi:predicted acyl esterase